MQLHSPFGGHGIMAGVRARADVFGRHYGLDQSLRRCLQAASTDATDPLPTHLVSELYAHWGDPLTQGGENYLRSCLLEARKAQGHILQCGASLLSLLLGALCAERQDKDKQLWCLEQDTHWANVVRSWLTQYEVNAAHVISAPAQMFERYVWYAVDPGRLAQSFSLVLCDGARATPRGVIGTLDRLANRLAPDGVVLARRVAGRRDLTALTRWAGARSASCVLVDKREGFVKITRRPDEPDPNRS